MHALSIRSPGFAAVQQMVFHAAVSVLAIGIAFSLPWIAGLVLHEWWPRVTASSRLLLVTELGLAAGLVLLFNALHLAWEGLRVKRLHDIAALVQVRRNGTRPSGKFARRSVPAARDALILSVTGHDTFGAAQAPFRELVDHCFETRVLLLDPGSEGAREKFRSRPDPAEAEARYREEIGASIAYLKALRESGRRVSLRLHGRAPFWGIVVAGEQAWVRCCHEGDSNAAQPDYVFALRPDEPAQGLFPPFCLYALGQWNDPSNAEYDFATGEIVHRAAGGGESGRRAFALPAPG